MNQRGTIQCTFQDDDFGIYWYNSTDTVKEKPVLNFKGSVKSGIGFASGEYDVHPNGSLIINNVTVRHDNNFTVVKLNLPEEIPPQYTIHVYTIIYPNEDFPLIENCRVENRACFLHVNETTELSCVVRSVRPAVSLSWGIPADEEISSTMTIENDTLRYTSHITTNITFSRNSFLNLFVCKATSVPLLLKFSTSYIVVENGRTDFSSLESVTRYFKRGSQMELYCGEDGTSYLAWFIVSKTGKEYETSLLAIYVNKGAQEIYSQEFNVGNKGSLIVRQVGIAHEGRYGCVYENGVTDGRLVHDVVVYVDPLQPFPTISGCEGERHCVLDLGYEGMLTCYINGIRPEVQLSLRPLYHSSPVIITFYNQKTIVKSNGDTYDVTVTTSFSSTNPTNNRIAVECKAIGPNPDLFDLSVTIDLWVSLGNENASDWNKPVDRTEDVQKINYLFILLLPILLIFGVVLVVCKVHRSKSKVDEEMNREEALHMLAKNLNNTDQKNIFIQQLKIKYQTLYDSVQPIPYLKEKLYCVNSVFIEGEFEVKNHQGKTEPTEQWGSVNSYHDVFTESNSGSMRSILQGDAGHGKSTFTLQLTYEWCKEVKSPLKNVEILILLRLRQLGRTSSIYGAIRQFLLPKDSTLKEDDIKTILQNTSSILIILDGYDEYPKQDEGTEVNLIIKRDMFQQIPVIVTTRSSCLPTDYPPQTKHLRLNGFNETAREKYIYKIVVGDDFEAAKRIKQRLIENPVLSGLCQVPLFFAMFAHMTYERLEFETFNSVTSFFSYMISCFHSHMRNKIKDKAELELFQQFEDDHSKLDKFALEALSAERKKDIWNKDDMILSIGQGLYEYYLKIGILVEDDVLDMNKGPSIFQYKTEVRFFHKIFCEWYAAHLLSEHAAGNGIQYLRRTLKYLDPFEYHYVYRFACGLHPKATDSVLEYLKCIIEGQEFSVLCILEQLGKVDKLTENVKYLSSGVVVLVNKNNKLQLRSTIQILEIASSNAIPIPCVSIENCFQYVDCMTWNISLGSGQFLSNLSSMEELRLYEMGRELKGQEVNDIFRFASQCLSLKTLRFDSCLLPWSITTKKTPADLNSNEIQVAWNPIGKWYRWNSNSNCWEDKHEGVTFNFKQYESEVERFRTEWSHTHWQESKGD
ncbi:NLR family CARD domain-containing protein 4 [Holothuria leucospilota]|uniref:NLR family CARD domain-containing protein 4 n=1 Tax=Holothuria leucospilota TaxID=206669 RepID=A0A9Q0YAW3_HOLLE|nr:NLR family CARD domain-containing protein 4 [Holothuria leucospilota]